MTEYYDIAGCIIEIHGENLEYISGFSAFLSDTIPSTPPILTIHSNIEIEVTYNDDNLLYEFDEESGNCKFFNEGNFYSLRMEDTDKKLWHLKIEQRDKGFFAYTNMNKETDSAILRFALWVAFGISALSRQTLSVHASTIIYNAKSILFLGESGTGKSTQTKNWIQYRPSSELLNDDSPFVRINEDQNVVVYGSPWSGKTPCYKNKHTSIAAFIRLRQAPKNAIRRLSTIEAIGALHPSFPPIFGKDAKLRDLILECLSPILKQIPVYALDCLPNEDAVKLVYTTLKKDGWLK